MHKTYLAECTSQEIVDSSLSFFDKTIHSCSLAAYHCSD